MVQPLTFPVFDINYGCDATFVMQPYFYAFGGNTLSWVRVVQPQGGQQNHMVDPKAYNIILLCQHHPYGSYPIRILPLDSAGCVGRSNIQRVTSCVIMFLASCYTQTSTKLTGSCPSVHLSVCVQKRVHLGSRCLLLYFWDLCLLFSPCPSVQLWTK